MHALLPHLTGPADLKSLTTAQVEALAAEIREELMTTVPRVGGHFAPNLGTVELSIALHRVFASPTDKIVWDTGHQAYPHKLLTGRYDRFSTIRQYGGLSGFLAREESEHDMFGAGHASTSISAALGMSVARDLQGGTHHVIAVIGDGALTCGLAYEAINNAGILGKRLIVVINDNAMSIAPNVGAVSRVLTHLRTDPRYGQAKEGVEQILHRVPLGTPMLEVAKRFKTGLQDVLYLGVSRFWDEMGFTYLGPIDGHKIQLLEETLRLAGHNDRPVVLHVMTQKGKGSDLAEVDSRKWHAVAPPKPNAAPVAPPPTYTSVFASALADLAGRDPRVVAITAAMPDGTGLTSFAARFPERFFDVGIAEGHAVTFAAGLATQGIRPVVAIYSTFLQRAYDNIIHDVCAQNLPVAFALDRAGIVGDDGRTHQGVFDLSYLRLIPNMVVMAPKDEAELRDMLATAVWHNGPSAMRYPRGVGLGVSLAGDATPLPIGVAEVLRRGDDLALIALGSTVAAASKAADLLAADGIAATVVNARFAKPLDAACILEVAHHCKRLVTVEENALAGGFGSAVAEALLDANINVQLLRLGIGDSFVDHGPQDLLRDLCDISAEGIVRRARARFLDLFSMNAHARSLAG